MFHVSDVSSFKIITESAELNWREAKDGDIAANAYEADTSIPDEIAVGVMHLVNDDGTHEYYDLQGRPLQRKPVKGLYIQRTPPTEGE